MQAAAARPSIYDLTPLEFGGVEARAGFAFQDHVAISFCLHMLEGTTLKEVWCETLDDITLIHELAAGACVEFVQVKSNEFDQLWSVAKLCERDGSAAVASHCILERSLSQDRCSQRCRFRMVTARPVNEQLAILTNPFDAPSRVTGNETFDTLCELLKPRVEAFRSENGNDYTFWAANIHWDVRHSEDAVRNANLLKLNSILHGQGILLAPDQVDEFYTKLLKQVWDASRTDPRVSVGAKRLRKDEYKTWFVAAAANASAPTVGVAEKLEEKMLRASIPADTIALAIEQARHYRAELLRPKYMDLDAQKMVQGEVQALLQRLKSRIDNGNVVDDGIQFHGMCLEELEQLRETLALNPKPLSAFLQGCMYHVTGRCLHRFRRITA